MKKQILLFLALTTMSCFAEESNVTTPKQQDSTSSNFSNNSFQLVEKRMTELEKMLKEQKTQPTQQATLQAPTGGSGKGTSLDVTSLPLVEGTFSVKKDGKVVSNGALVNDGGAEMYLTTQNNKAVQKIGDGYVVYKAGSTVSPVIYNKTTMKTDGLKADFNEFSANSLQAPQTPKKLPTFDEMVSGSANK